MAGRAWGKVVDPSDITKLGKPRRLVLLPTQRIKLARVSAGCVRNFPYLRYWPYEPFLRQGIGGTKDWWDLDFMEAVRRGHNTLACGCLK
jgi:hypothetical protein